ncbi:MAG: TolC family protein [Bacteroidales bacterium]|jgi:outer membrane protein TolC|nr:TolC family protein [Bacteroidales bacterium]
MRKIVIVLLFITNVAFAQQKQVVRLQDCYESMLVNYPLASQSDIYQQSSELSIKNLKTNWLPNAELKAQATYQSDVLELNLDLPISFDLPTMPKDQYKATVDINQLIYDWGRIKSAKQLESINLKTNIQTSHVELNKIKEQINKFYFAILILERNEELLGVMLNDLGIKQKSVQSGVKNGVLLSSELSALKAEILKVNQSVNEIKNQRLATIDVLSEITGISLTYESEFEIPEYEIDNSESLKRPESVLFNYQKEKLDATTKLVSKQNKPTVFAFTQLGYGKPGLNMLNDQFDSYYYVGVGLNWKFWDWSKTSREKKIVLLNKDLVSTQESTFNKQINIALKNESAKIKIYEDAVESDKEIIKLREEVTESARSKLDNGVITSTDYITELSKETQAKINYETHKIQLIQSKVNYLYIKGEI